MQIDYIAIGDWWLNSLSWKRHKLIQNSKTRGQHVVRFIDADIVLFNVLA